MNKAIRMRLNAAVPFGEIKCYFAFAIYSSQGSTGQVKRNCNAALELPVVMFPKTVYKLSFSLQLSLSLVQINAS